MTGIRLALLALAASLCGCVAIQDQRQASAIAYLYPKGRPDAPAPEIRLQLPLRVGVAFAPRSPTSSDPGGVFSEPQQREILKRVAAAFGEVPEVQFVDVIPTHDLSPQGGFPNLQQIGAMYGMNLVALVSYDQVEFQTPRRISILYWTLVGAYFVEGEQLETHTLLDANVFDLASQAMLFSGSGSSIVRDTSTPLEIDEKRRTQCAAGFEQAADDLIDNLKHSLAAFREHAKQGTVRGMGTPRIQVQSPDVMAAASHAGAGALGPLELVAVAGLAAAALRARRR